MQNPVFIFIAGLAVGVFIGALLAWLWGLSQLSVLKERLSIAEREIQNAVNAWQENEQLRIQLTELKKEREADAEKLQWVERAQEHLRDAFKALASESLQSNAEEFLKRARDQLDALLNQVRGDWQTQKAELQGLVEPLEETLKTLDSQVRELEQKREGAYQGLQEQLRQLANTHQRLQNTTISLVQALKSPSIRGRWGEVQLRRLVEMAGMVDHVDFNEQAATDEGRPDMIVRLPREGILPVDSKTPMQAYLEAIEAPDEQAREAKLNEHAQAMRHRVHELSQKRYWQQFERTPEFVVMFVPNEACLSAAFERDPNLLEYAFQQHVLPTTPVTLLALLKAVAYGWQQQQVTENARQIAEQGRQLYERVSVFVNHLVDLGKRLDQAVQDYNEAIGSLESRVLPAARRFRDLGAVTTELPSPAPIERQVRLPTPVESLDLSEPPPPLPDQSSGV